MHACQVFLHCGHPFVVVSDCIVLYYKDCTVYGTNPLHMSCSVMCDCPVDYTKPSSSVPTHRSDTTGILWYHIIGVGMSARYTYSLQYYELIVRYEKFFLVETSYIGPVMVQYVSIFICSTVMIYYTCVGDISR